MFRIFQIISQFLDRKRNNKFVLQLSAVATCSNDDDFIALQGRYSSGKTWKHGGVLTKHEGKPG